MKALCFFDILHKISSSLLVKMLDKRKTGGLAENSRFGDGFPSDFQHFSLADAKKPPPSCEGGGARRRSDRSGPNFLVVLGGLVSQHALHLVIDDHIALVHAHARLG